MKNKWNKQRKRWIAFATMGCILGASCPIGATNEEALLLNYVSEDGAYNYDIIDNSGDESGENEKEIQDHIDSNGRPINEDGSNADEATDVPFDFGENWVNISATIKGYNGQSKETVIPNTIFGIPVTDMKADAFWNATTLKKVTINANMNPYSVSASNFYGCYALEEFAVAEGNRALYTEDGVLFVNGSVLAYPLAKSATEYVIPDSDQTSILTVRVNPFAGNPYLQSVAVSEGNLNYQIVDGVLFDQEMTTLIYYPAGKLDESYTVPDGVYSICGFAFADAKNLKELYLPESVVDVYTANSATPSFGYDYEGEATSLVVHIDPSAYLYEELQYSQRYEEENVQYEEYMETAGNDENHAIQQKDTSWHQLMISIGIVVVCGFLFIRLRKSNKAMQKRREMLANKKKNKDK